MRGNDEMFSAEEIRGLIYYNPETGGIKRRGLNGELKYKSLFLSDTGYQLISLFSVDYRVHRIAWLYHYGVHPKNEIDHINGDRADNSICNLRDVTHSENMRNVKNQANNKSGVRGVYWSKAGRRWVAQIKVDKKWVYIGQYKDYIAAIKARKMKEAEYGFHKNHGRK